MRLEIEDLRIKLERFEDTINFSILALDQRWALNRLHLTDLVIFFGFSLKRIECIKFIISHDGSIYFCLPAALALPCI